MIKRNSKGSSIVGCAIVDMYAKSEEQTDAKRKFKLIPNKDNA